MFALGELEPESSWKERKEEKKERLEDARACLHPSSFFCLLARQLEQLSLSVFQSLARTLDSRRATGESGEESELTTEVG